MKVMNNFLFEDNVQSPGSVTFPSPHTHVSSEENRQDYLAGFYVAIKPFKE